MSTDKINAAAKLIVDATRTGAKRAPLPEDLQQFLDRLRTSEQTP